jgi:hypothetical protein
MAAESETLALEEIPHSDAHVLDLQDVKQRVDTIHRIMARLMKQDVHYGVIPGTKKPTLYKPGSEILLTAFRVAIEPEITDLSTPEEIRYRIRAFGKHVPTSLFMGAGVGECSSNEEKFLWRAALSKEEFADTPEDQKRYKYKKEWDRGRPMVVKVEQIKVPPADAANAVLKRAKKRAQVDFCLTAMAASEIFTQDVEDLPDGYLNDDSAPIVPNEPRIDASQLAELRKGLTAFKDPAKAEQRLCQVFKIKELKDLSVSNLREAQEKVALGEKPQTVSEEQEANLTALIDEIGPSCKADFLKTNRIEKISDLPASQYKGAFEGLEAKRRGDEQAAKGKHK